LFADVDFTIVDVIHEYVSFVGSFFIVGAAAFYFLLLRPSVAPESPAMTVAARTAARIGVFGGLLRLLSILMSVIGRMNSKNLTFFEVLGRNHNVAIGAVVTIIAIFAFAAAGFAAGNLSLSWAIAAIATLVIALRGIITTDLEDIVNPLHVFAASLWIGTLFVLVVAGISTYMKSALKQGEAGPAVAAMVNRFSTLALWSTGLLVLTGVTTAYIHLRKFSALWTSIYGQTLLVKLCLVTVVISLGAYNNMRVKPTLGADEGNRRIYRSATWEIAVAAIVLIVTAVLVNLPAPGEHMAH
jgi:putative copper export protein